MITPYIEYFKNKLKYSLILLILISLLSSCNYFQEKSLPNITELNPPGKSAIETIATLPFVNLTDAPDITSILRTSFSSNLSLKGYTAIRLEEIDGLLKMAEIDASNIESIDPYQLGRILKADALIYGTVTKCSKLFVGIYSNVAVGAQIKMIDCRTNKTIWAAEHLEKTHGGGSVSVSPFNIPREVVESLLNIRDKVISDTADKLVKKFILGIPENTYEAEERTAIVSISGSGNDKTVNYVIQKGDTLYKVADKFYGNSARWKEIKAANGNLSESTLQTGQKIVVPDVPILNNLEDAHSFKQNNIKNAVYKLKWGDSLYKIASELYNNGDKWNIIQAHNKNTITSLTDVPVGQVLILPLQINK